MDLLESLAASSYEGTDFTLEVGTFENAERIFNLGRSLALNLFSQKTNWNLVKTLDAVPVGYREGSLFVTADSQMNWGYGLS